MAFVKLNYMRPYRRRQDARYIERLEAEVSRLRIHNVELESAAFEARAESLGEHIWMVGLNQMESRIGDLEAQVTRLQNAIRGCVNRMEPREARTAVEAHTKPGDLDPLGGDDELPR